MKRLLLTTLLATPAAAQTDPQRLSADVKVLASDAFEGRAPGRTRHDAQAPMVFVVHDVSAPERG